MMARSRMRDKSDDEPTAGLFISLGRRPADMAPMSLSGLADAPQRWCLRAGAT